MYVCVCVRGCVSECPYLKTFLYKDRCKETIHCMCGQYILWKFNVFMPEPKLCLHSSVI